MEIKESFVIHTEWIEDLPEEYKGAFLTYIYNYGSRGEEPQGLEGLVLTIWIKIKRRMDEDQEKWENTKSRRSEAGSRGANKRWSKESAPQEETYTNEAEIQEEKPKKKFKKPTVEEVSEYCEERKNTVDPQQFINYYEANGWKVGKNAMKDWKAAIRNWETRQQTQYGAAPPVRTLPDDRITL